MRTFFWRDLAGAPDGFARDTRVPASPYPGLLWLVRGEVVIRERDGQFVHEPIPSIALSGAHRRAYYSVSDAGGDFFCVAFQPGALALLTGRDVSPLTDCVQKARKWLPDGDEGVVWSTWLHSVLKADSHAERVRLCEAFLAPRWAALVSQRAAWTRLLGEQWSRSSRQDLTEELGWTPRHFQRRVLQLTGLRAGEVERMLRVEQALLSMRDAGASVVDAAMASGFSDQAHFSRESRSVFERPPASLRNHLLSEREDADWMLRRAPS